MRASQSLMIWQRLPALTWPLPTVWGNAFCWAAHAVLGTTVWSAQDGAYAEGCGCFEGDRGVPAAIYNGCALGRAYSAGPSLTDLACCCTLSSRPASLVLVALRRFT